MIISNGKLLIDNTPANISRKSKFHNTVHISIEEKSNTELRKELLKLGVSKEIIIESDYCIVRPLGNNLIIKKIQEFIKRKSYTIRHFSSEQGNLEDVFRELTKDE